MHEREGAKKWKKRFCILRASGIYYSTKGESEVRLRGRVRRASAARSPADTLRTWLSAGLAGPAGAHQI